MTKQCTCKDGKKDPKCPSCAKDINLDSFHKLNPEAKPHHKTAERFKLAARPGLGLIGGMDPATKERLMGHLQGALIPAAATAIPAAMLAGATADKGEGLGDAAKAGLMAGGSMLAANTAHNMMMTGKSPLSHSYQRGIGSDFRNIANKGRELMGAEPVKMPRPPPAKVASADHFKLGYHDPYGRPLPPEAAYYGQYGQDPNDQGLSGFDKALLLGGGTALAGGLHHTLMGARGNIRGDGLINAYQKGIGGKIREGGNVLRGAVGMEPVAQPPHPIVGHAQDLVQGAVEGAKNLYTQGKKIAPAVAGVVGTAATGKAIHDKLMKEQTNAGELYRRVGTPLESAANKAVDVGQRAAGWVAKKTAPKPKAEAPISEEMKKKVAPKITKAADRPKPVTPTVKKSSLIYQAGADAALATYMR